MKGYINLILGISCAVLGGIIWARHEKTKKLFSPTVALAPFSISFFDKDYRKSLSKTPAFKKFDIRRLPFDLVALGPT